jgi:hypothetical protein
VHALLASALFILAVPARPCLARTRSAGINLDTPLSRTFHNPATTSLDGDQRIRATRASLNRRAGHDVVGITRVRKTVLGSDRANEHGALRPDTSALRSSELDHRHEPGRGRVATALISGTTSWARPDGAGWSRCCGRGT